MEEIAGAIRKQGEIPYVIPYGGSNAVGATGYVQAMVELSDQLAGLRIAVDRIIVASSSGGTQAGLVVGSRMTGFRGRITGISIDKGEREEIPYERELSHLSNDISKWIGFEHTFSEQDFDVCYDYLGEGYGVVGQLEREAIRLVARHEGILLDPVYTGRAMGALVEMIRRQVLLSQLKGLLQESFALVDHAQAKVHIADCVFQCRLDRRLIAQLLGDALRTAVENLSGRRIQNGRFLLGKIKPDSSDFQWS